MKTAKSAEEIAVGENVSGGTKVDDPVAEYRSSITDLSAALEKVGTLRQLEVSLRADADGIATTREKLLADSVSAGDEDGTVEELSRLRSRGEVYERKIGDVSGRIGEAEGELAAIQSAVASQFSALWHGFYQHALQRAKDSLSEQLVPGIANHIIELCASHTHAVVAARKLDIRTTDPESLLVQANRLLEAIEAEPTFVVPPYTPPAPVAPELDPLWTPGQPWGDRGVDVDAEIRAMHQADPTLTLPRAMRLLYEKFPHVFEAPKGGSITLNEPLKWQAPMIGSTTVPEPAEEQFLHAR